MKILLIRHGTTPGNRLKRYIGRTDEPLAPESDDILRKKAYPTCDFLYVSPLLRCKQTAKIVYPGCAYTLCENLRECDFGDFEGKNYRELSDNPAYQAWVDSAGTLPFPNGESNEHFKSRCVQAFAKIVQTHADGETLAFVVHGGTIMAILERFSDQKRGFYDWQVENGGGYAATCIVKPDQILLMEVSNL